MRLTAWSTSLASCTTIVVIAFPISFASRASAAMCRRSSGTEETQRICKRQRGRAGRPDSRDIAIKNVADGCHLRPQALPCSRHCVRAERERRTSVPAARPVRLHLPSMNPVLNAGNLLRRSLAPLPLVSLPSRFSARGRLPADEEDSARPAGGRPASTCGGDGRLLQGRLASPRRAS